MATAPPPRSPDRPQHAGLSAVFLDGQLLGADRLAVFLRPEDAVSAIPICKFVLIDSTSLTRIQVVYDLLD